MEHEEIKNDNKMKETEIKQLPFYAKTKNAEAIITWYEYEKNKNKK